MSNLLRVVPESIEFRDLGVGESDSIDVFVTNISRKSTKIRFKSTNPLFKLSKTNDFALTPGLTIKNNLSFTATSKDAIEGILEVFNDEVSFKIPIKTYPPLPALSINTKKIEFGDITLSSNQFKNFTITNYGGTIGTFKITPTNEYATVNPSEGVLDSNQKSHIALSFKPPKPGFYEFDLNISTRDNTSILEPIKVSANVIDQSITAIENGKPVDNIDFGNVFWGEVVEKKVLFRNTSPIKQTIIIHDSEPIPGKPGDEFSFFKPKDKELVIEGHQDKEAIIVISPPAKDTKDNSETKVSQVCLIEVKNTSIRSEVIFSASFTHLIVVVQPLDYYFGRIKNLTTSTEIMKIQNKINNPITFNIKEIAGFTFVPTHGTIKENDTKEIEITFHPNALGPYQQTTTITFCHGVLKRKLTLTGESLTKSLDEGDDYVRKPLWESDEATRHAAEFPENPFTMTLPELQRKTQLTKTFHDYITNAATARAVKTEKSKMMRNAKLSATLELSSRGKAFTKRDLLELSTKKFAELEKKKYDIDLGFTYGEGLIPPEPRTLSPRARFKGEPPPLTFDPLAVKMRLQSNKRKIKVQPTTKLEISETSRVLTQQQQLQISPSTETIDFGQIPVFTTEKREFTVTNNLTQHIFVSLDVKDEDFELTDPSTQVIFPQQSGTFMITIKAKKSGEIDKTIKYTINHHHEYLLHVHAEIRPLELILSTNDLLLRFSPDQTDNIVTDTITLTNPTNSIAQYRWNGFNDIFTIRPTHGTLLAKSTVSFEVTYRPANDPHSEIKAALSVVGGPQQYLKITGETGNNRLSLDSYVADFELVPVGVNKLITLKLKNEGTDPGIFNLYPNFTDVMNIEPPTGVVEPGETIPIDIVVNCSKEGAFDVPITLSCCGMKPLTFVVKGQAISPRVEIDYNDSLEFGGIYIGNNVTRHFVLSNKGIMDAFVDLDLSNQPNYRIEYPAKYEGKTEENSITHITKDDDPSLNLYQMTLKSNSKIDFDFIFKPVVPGDCSFELPISSNNIEISAKKPLKVVAEALTAPIAASTSWLDFGVTTLIDPLNPNIKPTVRELVLSNKTKGKIKFQIDTNKLDPAFTVDKVEGEIKFASSCPIFVMFKPTEGRVIECSMILYAIQEDGTKLKCAKIELTAVINNTTFTISNPLVVFPVVPLDVPVERTIYLINTMFIEAHIDAIVPLNEKMFPVTVQFPEGQELKHTMDRLPIKICFQSPKPLSMSTQIAIVSSEGSSITFTVACSTDNSILSLEPFTMMNEFNLVRNPVKPITIIAKNANSISDDFLSYVTSLKDIENYNFTRPAYCEQTYDFIKDILNSYVLNTKIEDISTDFSNSDGDLLIEMIINLAGQKKPVAVSNSTKMKSDSDDSKVTKMKNLLTAITTVGGCVSNINPLFLTQKNTFMSIQKKNIIKLLLPGNELERSDEKFFNHFINSDQFQSKLKPRLKKFDHLFKDISRAAWLSVILQALKVFYLTKGETEKLINIPGVPDALKQIEGIPEFPKNTKLLDASNYQSKIEGLILRWVTIHAFKENGPGLMPVTFDDLRNPLFFGFLIRSHIPSMHIPLIERVIDDDENFENARAVVDALNSISLGIDIKEETILNGNPIMLLFLAFQLMQVLPHYIPTTELIFEAQLNTVIQQAITIQNPSKSEISYHVTIQGSPNFSVPEEYLVIKPNSSEDCIVYYSARTHNPEHGMISFVPGKKVTEPSKSKSGSSSRRSLAKMVMSSQRSIIASNLNPSYALKEDAEPPAHPSTIIMQMKSEVTIGFPSDILKIEGVLYEHTHIELEIPNRCQIAGSYRMKCVMCKAYDENGQPMLTRKMDTDLLQSLFVNYSKTNSKASSVHGAKKQDQIDAFTSIAKNHKPFIFGQQDYDFDEHSATVPIEFVPISFGIFKCYLLFSNARNGEFIVEIDGKTLNIPQGSDSSPVNYKAEAKTKTEIKLPVDVINKPLINAISYSLAKQSAFEMSEVQFQEYLTNTIKEITTCYSAIVGSIKFRTSCSLNTFSLPEEVTLNTISDANTVIVVKFLPDRPGRYHAKIVLMNDYDVRFLKITAIALAPTKQLDIEMETTSGKDIVQYLPFDNPSDTVWNFKVEIFDSDYFKCDSKFQVKPKSTYDFPLTFRGRKVGTFKTELTVTNLNKECSVKYNIIGTVGEPLAEEKITVSVRARDHSSTTINLPSFVKFGTIDVTSDIPILEFPHEIQFIDGAPREKFKFTANPKVSGFYAGSIVFTDRDTKIYCWYMVEVEVKHPIQTQAINVKGTQREKINVTIPLSNDLDHPVTYIVKNTETDLICPPKVTVPPNTDDFPLKIDFQPYTSFKRESIISLISEDMGEFIYKLNIEVTTPSVVVLSPLTALVGKSSKTFVNIMNPKEVDAHFKVVCTDPEVFIVEGQENGFIVPAYQTRNIDITFMPATIGIQQSALVTFESTEIGEYIFKLTGVGKPPQPSSPYIIEASINSANSGCIVFTNPFHHPASFNVSLSNNDYLAFNLLMKKRHDFVLQNYRDAYQISFSFMSKKFGQYAASIVVSSGGTLQSRYNTKDGKEIKSAPQRIAWKFPIIGITSSGTGKQMHVLSGVAKVPIIKQIPFYLPGETDNFPASSYQTSLEIQRDFQWISKYLETKVDSVKHTDEGYSLLITIKLTIRKQVDCIVNLSIMNEISQSWKFPIHVVTTQSEICGQMTIMSTINNAKNEQVVLNENFPMNTDFYAYFLPGYSEDLSLSCDSGTIAASMSGQTKVPVEVVYAPKVYGKYTKGTLVIETKEAEYLISVTGRIPEYVPPVVKTSSISEYQRQTTPTLERTAPRRRNIIKENIENAKITKPKSARRTKRVFYY